MLTKTIISDIIFMYPEKLFFNTFCYQKYFLEEYSLKSLARAMSSHLTASASGVHSTIRNRNTNGMFIMYMPQMFDKSFSVRACCLRGFFFYTKVPFVTIKYCWQDREFTPPSPCAGVHSTTTPPETQRQQHQVVYHIFLFFSRH